VFRKCLSAENLAMRVKEVILFRILLCGPSGICLVLRLVSQDEMVTA